MTFGGIWKRGLRNGSRKMAKQKRQEPLILLWLEKTFDRARKPITPLYPYDPETDAILLPPDVEQELRLLASQGYRPVMDTVIRCNFS